MKIDASKVLMTLGGQHYKTPEGQDLTLGAVLAEAMATYEAGGKMKSYVLANKFYNDKEVEVDEADLALVKKAVESCKAYNNLITGQALLCLN